MNIPQTVPDLMVWLTTSGGLIWLASFAIERLRSFQQLTETGKKAAVAVLVVVVAFGARLLLDMVPAAVWDALQPYYEQLVVVVGVIWTLFMSQAAHKADKWLLVGDKKTKTPPRLGKDR